MSALAWNVFKSVLAIQAVAALYRPFEWCLQQCSVQFPKLTRNQQTYSVKNAVKSVVLAACTPMALFILYERLCKSQYSHVSWIRMSGQLYAACDIVALAKMHGRLPFSTTLHHTMVLAFSFVNLMLDYNDWQNPWSNLAVVASTSCLSYSVNYYLSLRKLCATPEDEDALRRAARWGLVTYLPTFLFAVGFNLYTVQPTTTHGALFLGLMLPVWYDDCVLLRHLWSWW